MHELFISFDTLYKYGVHMCESCLRMTGPIDMDYIVTWTLSVRFHHLHYLNGFFICLMETVTSKEITAKN